MLYSRLPASRKMRLMSSTRGSTTTRSACAEPGAACPVTPLVDSAASRVERHNPAAVTMTMVNRCIDFIDQVPVLPDRPPQRAETIPHATTQLASDSGCRLQVVTEGVAVAAPEAQLPPLVLPRADQMLQAQRSRARCHWLSALGAAIVALLAQLIPPLP